MTLKVYNTLTGRKEDFQPREPGKVGMYVCGPTVYNYIHIGNARCYLTFDIVKRYLKFRGFQVFHVQNFTDVDDKIIDQANREGVPAEAVADKYTEAFIEDARALGIEPPDLAPKATEHISEMIDTIATLVESGYAYSKDGDVFFRVESFPGYGRLSKRNLEEMQAGARVEVDLRKHSPMDFVLWKKAKPGEPKWPSPWGDGRPGWHIECSTMSLKYLGMSFDIHGGGQDLIFPHHENEIAQAECYAGSSPFVKYWMHNGFVTILGDKMAKSVGNIILVKDILKRYEAPVVRILFLTTHYRSPIDFSEAKLKEAQAAYERLNTFIGNIDRLLSERRDTFSDLTGTGLAEGLADLSKTTEEEFLAAMDDDFNAPDALGALFKLAREVNTYLAERPAPSLDETDLLEDIKGQVVRLGEALGLKFSSFLTLDKVGSAWRAEHKEILVGGLDRFAGERPAGAARDYDGDFAGFIQRFIELRADRRAAADWTAADEIRAFLNAAGIVLEDTPAGTYARVRKVITS